MCGVQLELRRFLLAFGVLALLACGCSKSQDNTVADTKLPSGTGQAINPSGKLTPDQQVAADQRNQAGQAAGQNMARAAQQMKEAQARSGGK